LSPSLHQTAQKGRPEGAIFGGADVDAEDLALALRGHADRHDGRLARDVPVDAHLVVCRIHPDVGMLADERPCAKRLHERIELAADPRHL
jgi:hypothetical protein